MTVQAQGRVPSITLGWRLKIALGDADFKAEDMAAALGVSRQTISRWMAGHGARPRRAYLAQWALLTGVSLDWLEHGTGATPPPAGQQVSQRRPIREVPPKTARESPPTCRYPRTTAA